MVFRSVWRKLALRATHFRVGNKTTTSLDFRVRNGSSWLIELVTSSRATGCLGVRFSSTNCLTSQANAPLVNNVHVKCSLTPSKRFEPKSWIIGGRLQHLLGQLILQHHLPGQFVTSKVCAVLEPPKEVASVCGGCMYLFQSHCVELGFVGRGQFLYRGAAPKTISLRSRCHW